MEVIITAIPAWESTVETIGRARISVINALVAQAARELRISVDRLVSRQLLPSDLGLESWDINWKDNTQNWLSWCDATMADMKYVAISGVCQCSIEPSVSELKINVGGADRVIYPLDNLYSLLPAILKLETQPTNWVEYKFGCLENMRMEAYFTTSVIIPMNTHFQIKLKRYNAKGKDILVLRGIVVEPRGKVISP